MIAGPVLWLGAVGLTVGLLLVVIGALVLFSTPPMDREVQGRHRRPEDADPPENGHTVI